MLDFEIEDLRSKHVFLLLQNFNKFQKLEIFADQRQRGKHLISNLLNTKTPQMRSFCVCRPNGLEFEAVGGGFDSYNSVLKNESSR
jgi:hypothetical protein